MTALALLAGAGVGLGIALVIAGWRGSAHVPATISLRRRLERMNLRVSLAIGAAVLIGAATRWPAGALLAGLGGFFAPGLWRSSRASAAVIARVEAIASWTEMLRDTLAGAAGLEQAIVASAPLAPLPIRAEVLELAAALDRDRLADALRRFADEVADPTCDLVVAALVLAADHQAQHLGDLLGSLARSARDQAGMRLRIEATRARTRTSVRVIVGATVGLCVLIALFDRSFLAPYGSALGQLVLLVIGAIFAAAFVWLQKMTRPLVPERFLAGADAHQKVAR